MYRLFILSVWIIVIAACNNNRQPGKTPPGTVPDSPSAPISPRDTSTVASPENVLLQITQEILAAFKQKDYTVIARYADPEKGVRFSPYGFVDTLHHKVLTKEQIATGHSSKALINWGNYDGTGEPINLAFADYMKKFVYDVDFLNPESRKVNEFIGSGNSLNNLQGVYKDADFVESYFSGFDKKYGGMDWRSLRLVFKKVLDNYKLIAVVHDQWTS